MKSSTTAASSWGFLWNYRKINWMRMYKFIWKLKHMKEKTLWDH